MDTRTLDEALATLRDRSEAWAHLPVARKTAYLDGVIRGTARLAERQVEASNLAKGIAPGTPAYGEEWAHPFAVVRVLRLLKETLGQIAASGRPLLPRGSVRTLAGGEVAVRVFPLGLADRLLFSGYCGEVRLPRGVTAADLHEHMAAFYREANPKGKVALVLGAGNVASVGPTDLAHKLFAEGRVCLYKHNPVNEYLGPFLDEAWAELIRDGFVRTCAGGPDVGDYLCRHDLVDEIHLTGSDRTYEAVVFGPGAAGTERKRRNEPRLAKSVTCELGNATPVIVVPGPWSPSDVAYQADHIATQVANNCGFNCLSARLLVTAKGWDLSDALLEAIGSALSSLPERPAYYPGAEARYDEAIAANPGARPLRPRRPGVLPYTLIPGLDPADGRNPLFAGECFAPVLGQTALPGADAAQFLRNAVRFCNETLWGTLSACVIVHPRTARALGPEIDRAVAGLRYGTVAVNTWSALGFVWGSTGWGAAPGHVPSDIQSGVGTVHNTFLFDAIEKSVIRGPFRCRPKPPWFVTHSKTGAIFARMVRLEASAGLWRVLPIGWLAVRG